MKKKRSLRVSIRQVFIKKDLDKVVLKDILAEERNTFINVHDYFTEIFIEALEIMNNYVKDPIPPLYVPESQSWLVTYARWDEMEGKRIVQNFAVAFKNSVEIKDQEKEKDGNMA